MAAQAWSVYGAAKKKIGNGTIDLSATAWKIALVKSTSNFATLSTLSLWTAVTNELDSTTGYASGGKQLSNESWISGASSLQIKFDADDVVWTATGSDITSILAAVIYFSGAPAAEHLLCAASLTSAIFTLSTGNTLTIQMNASGILTLT